MNERYSIQEIKSKYLSILAILEICTEEIPGEIYSEIFTKEQKKTDAFPGPYFIIGLCLILIIFIQFELFVAFSKTNNQLVKF